jgi:hypothetical protein
MSRQLIGVQARFARVMIGRKVTRFMRNPFRARPKSFLDSARREWQFDAFAWLLRNCGGYPKFLETALVLPIEEHFPDRGMSGHAGVTALFRCVRDHAGMADWPCTVEPKSQEPRTTATAEPHPGLQLQPGHPRTEDIDSELRTRARAIPGRDF